LNASFAAMRRSVRALSVQPDFMLIDGNRFRTAEGLPEYGCYVKGDARFASIAAASVLAKTHRDAYMLELHAAFPQYGWDANAGYPTKQHRSAIREHGTTSHHRSSFRQLPEQMTLFA
jgi:ribonuclease HII